MTHINAKNHQVEVLRVTERNYEYEQIRIKYYISPLKLSLLQGVNH